MPTKPNREDLRGRFSFEGLKREEGGVCVTDGEVRSMKRSKLIRGFGGLSHDKNIFSITQSHI